MEIRLHGRGGQGGVTCAKILAAVYARLGKSVQTFGDYAGERSGAPVRAYTRVSDEVVHNRNKVYRPDHLVVLDPTLLGEQVLSGLRPGGTLILNSPDPPATFTGQYEAFRVVTVDATAIARRHRIGTRSVVITNTTIAGAWMRVFDIPFEELEQVYHKLGFTNNLESAREAYDAVQTREAVASPTGEGEPQVVGHGPDVVSLPNHDESPPTGLKTGTWRSQAPQYVENLAPCSAFCPAGNDVIGFVRALAREGEEAAWKILSRTTPLPGVCGHVCPAPCMEGCNRAEYDGSLNIRGIERWIAERRPAPEAAPAAHPSAKRIAIVGGGPAGLSAAYFLARSGHKATLFEGEKSLGGILRTGIPVFRLPREVLDREIDAVLSLGVETRLGTYLDKDAISGLATEFDGVILSTGLQSLATLRVEGADREGVEQGIPFLHRVNIEGNVSLSGHVVVLGGGNTAIDCARSALRAGAAKVTIAYRRTRLEMPAIREEIEEAEAEGITLLFQRQPIGFTGSGQVSGITLAEVEMGEPDDSGRRRPIVTDRTEELACGTVLLAIGQWSDLSRVPEGWELREGRFWADGQGTNCVAAGDLSTGDGTVTHAIGDGRRAAGRILRALGVEADVFERPDREQAVPATMVRFNHFESSPPASDVVEPIEARRKDFRLVNAGLQDGRQEAGRCFSCGHCTLCDTCLVYCPEGVIQRNEAGTGYIIDYDYCKGCGICVTECPRLGMEMVQ